MQWPPLMRMGAVRATLNPLPDRAIDGNYARVLLIKGPALAIVKKVRGVAT
jgi:hypothetical protein